MKFWLKQWLLIMAALWGGVFVGYRMALSNQDQRKESSCKDGEPHPYGQWGDLKTQYGALTSYVVQYRTCINCGKAESRTVNWAIQ